MNVFNDMILLPGHKRVVLKSDGETFMTALKEAVRARVTSTWEWNVVRLEILRQMVKLKEQSEK